MKIAVVHSFYTTSVPSGENQVVLDQVEALASAGHEVRLIFKSTDEESKQALYRLKSAFRVATFKGATPLDELSHFNPDVIHIHNLFPNYGEDWVTKTDTPIVFTHHNFRSQCAAGTFLRDGESCFECRDSNWKSAIKHACYKQSSIATIPLAWASRDRGKNHPRFNSVIEHISLNSRITEMLTLAGVSHNRIHQIPNFVTSPPKGCEKKLAKNGKFLFVGRLTEEKGLKKLLEKWPSGYSLDVVGAGPLLPALKAKFESGEVRFLGALPNANVRALMPEYQALLFPSQSTEGSPVVISEAIGAKLPVILTEVVGEKESLVALDACVVIPTHFGISDVAGALQAAFSSDFYSAENAEDFLFTVDKWITETIKVYVKAMSKQVETT